MTPPPLPPTVLAAARWRKNKLIARACDGGAILASIRETKTRACFWKVGDYEEEAPSFGAAVLRARAYSGVSERRRRSRLLHRPNATGN